MLYCRATTRFDWRYLRATERIDLRDVWESDLPLFFDFQLDPEANQMAAFTAKDPTDKAAFLGHWGKILSDNTITNQTILSEGKVVGHVASYTDQEFGKPEVTYWIGREYWGIGIATEALLRFLDRVKTRPIYARAAKDNVASLRVLQKCGFEIVSEGRGFANARGKEVEELVLRLG